MVESDKADMDVESFAEGILGAWRRTGGTIPAAAAGWPALLL